MKIGAPQLPGVLSVVQTWASLMTNVVNALIASGTTAQRPTKLLWTGRPYYDESLAAGAGKPIWYNAASATGWRDSTGANV